MRNTVQDLSFQFAVKIVKFCNNLIDKKYVNQPIVIQLLKSGTSIGANVQEAEAAQSKKEFLSKMYIAFKEAREANYWLRIFIASNLYNISMTTQLLNDSVELIRLLSSITKSTRSNLLKEKVSRS